MKYCYLHSGMHKTGTSTIQRSFDNSRSMLIQNDIYYLDYSNANHSFYLYNIFIIVSPPRTGSTMVRRMLDSHRSICCHGELLGVNRVLGISGKNSPALATALKDVKESVYSQWLVERDRGLERFLDRVLKPEKCDVVGFKMLYNHFSDINLYCVNDYLERNRNIKIIFLSRANKLKWYVSYVKHKNKHRTDAPAKKIYVDPLVFLQTSTNFDMYGIDLKQRLQKRSHRNRIMHVLYEDIVDEKNQKMTEIFEFLGVSQETIDFQTEKYASNNLEELIENYNELKSYPELAQYL